MFEGNYSNPFTHLLMTADTERTMSYYRSIMKTVKPGDIVIDYGAGAGILTLVALKAGAEKVYAIERNSKAIETLVENLKNNNVADKVEIFHGDIDSFYNHYLDKISCDVIISECIGDHLFENKLTHDFLKAKEIYLKDQGKSIPSMLKLVAATKPFFSDKLNRLFKNLKKIEDTAEFILDPLLINKKKITNLYISNYQQDLDSLEVFSFSNLEDLKRYLKPKSVSTIENTIKLRSGLGHGILLYFEVFMPGSNEVFTNSPYRVENDSHSFYQRLLIFDSFLIETSEESSLSINIDYKYDKFNGESGPCQNIYASLTN